MFFTIHHNPSLAFKAVNAMRVYSHSYWLVVFVQPIAAESWRRRGGKLSSVLGKNTIFNEHPVLTRGFRLFLWVIRFEFIYCCAKSVTRGRISVQILCKDYEKCVANSSDAGNMARVCREFAKSMQRVCNNCLSMTLTKEIPPMIEQVECKERLLLKKNSYYA